MIVLAPFTANSSRPPQDPVPSQGRRPSRGAPFRGVEVLHRGQQNQLCPAPEAAPRPGPGRARGRWRLLLQWVEVKALAGALMLLNVNIHLLLGLWSQTVPTVMLDDAADSQLGIALIDPGVET